jgi:uncharacterized protein (DUF1501 family)
MQQSWFFQSSAITRRDVLRLSAALGLSWTLPALDPRAAEKRGGERPKSLIVLWMGGGPSQLETWDPHAGTKHGGEVGAIKTKVAGLEIADLYPKVAEQIQHLSVIRSLVSKEGDHERGTYLLKTGYRPEPTLRHPSLGAIVAHELPQAGIEIPRHVSLGATQWPGWGGFLGDEEDAFKVYNPNENLHNLASRVDRSRQGRRLSNLDVLGAAFRQGRELQVKKTLHRDTIDRALTMMQSDQLKAFQADDEPAAVRAAYGETGFGRGCLIARRLVEVGVRAIEVNLNGWDSHANNWNTHVANAAILDPAFAALTRDLHERDLLQSTVVLCIGEFGRTPTINPLGGRDHWPNGFSCVLGGGGLQCGQVIGVTDRQNQNAPPKNPIEVKDLYATVLHTLGVEYDKEVMTPIGRPMTYSAGKPIDQLVAPRA